MSQPLVDRIPFAKIVVALAVAFGLGLGLCGLDFFLLLRGSQTHTQAFGVGPVGVASLTVLILSAIGLVVTIILWVVMAMVASFSRKNSEPPQLLDEKDDEQKQGRDGPLD
jgi:hypothetical protein